MNKEELLSVTESEGNREVEEMARTVCYIQEHGYDTRANLEDAFSDVTAKLSDARKTLRATEDRIKVLNEQIHYVGQYQSHKADYQYHPRQA